ncbi:MAG: cytochrome c oxidase assembly protein, partial [Pseudolabrys sp.]
MVGAAYAAVPLYTWFCKTTGFGGTTQVSEKAPDHVLDRALTIRATVRYKVINEAAREIAGQASYNVS